MQRFTECNISKLDTNSKKRAWHAIQRDHPALAAFMRSEQFALLRDIMGVSLMVKVDSSGRILVQHGKK